MNHLNYKLPHGSAESLKRLVEGNERFKQGVRSIQSILSSVRFRELAEQGQSPFSIVLTCSDSRVHTETIFDCGLGDLFVIRVAGNVISPELVASIEFAAASFGTPLCVVMGHTGCGAINAALKYVQTGKSLNSVHGDTLISHIVPAVQDALEFGSHSESLATRTALLNVQKTVDSIFKMSPLLRGMIQEQKFSIVGGIYGLHTGEVLFDQDQIFQKLLQKENSELVDSICSAG